MNESDSAVYYLNNGILKAGILPDVGGRMVFFSTADGINLLKSDSAFWNEPKHERIEPTPWSDFKGYNGLITWLGPQSQWWTNQEVNPKRREDKSQWPPDPFLIYGSFTIVKSSDTSITLVGPDSPVSGVRLRKTYEMFEDKLKIHVEAENIRSSDVAWDLWSNARFDGYTKFFVPVRHDNMVRLITFDDDTREPLDYRIDKGMFTFIPEKPSDIKKRRLAKAFIHPDKGNIIVQKNKHILLIDFNLVDQEFIHPEQALVEVYSSFQIEPADDLLELEHHSAFRVLKPGEKLELTETWSIHDSDDTNDPQSQLETLLSHKNNE